MFDPYAIDWWLWLNEMKSTEQESFFWTAWFIVVFFTFWFIHYLSFLDFVVFLLIIDCKLPLTTTLLIFPLEDRRLFLAIAIEIDAFQGIFSFIFLLLALETLFFFYHSRCLHRWFRFFFHFQRRTRIHLSFDCYLCTGGTEMHIIFRFCPFKEGMVRPIGAASCIDCVTVVKGRN